MELTKDLLRLTPADVERLRAQIRLVQPDPEPLVIEWKEGDKQPMIVVNPNR